MAKRTIKRMMEDLPVEVLDAARLIVESAEVWELPRDSKQAFVSGFRGMVRLAEQKRRELERTVPFGEVVKRSLEARKGRRRSTVADLRSYAGRMVRHGDWAEKPLRGITAEECRRMLVAQFGHSLHAYRKARSVLHSLFTFGMRQDWCDKNPVDAIEAPRVEEKRIEPLAPPAIQRLMSACEAPDMADMAPAVSLMLWCGIRPGEVRRLAWSDINPESGEVYIEPRHSKTGGARSVPLRGRAAALCCRAEGAVAPRNWDKRWRELRRRAGLAGWQQDALRHTFASMHLRHFRNPPLLQAEMGHRDSSLLRTRYVSMRNISISDAADFWARTSGEGG